MVEEMGLSGNENHWFDCKSWQFAENDKPEARKWQRKVREDTAILKG
uniref:Uncharacterized protein n=1 Tax=Rhizophora mucronata TaxID=61149 RepID=A0A2P2QAH4_RHIMU